VCQSRCADSLAPTSYRKRAPGLGAPADHGLAGPPGPVRLTRRARRPAGYCNESKPPALAVARNEVHEVSG
jgi:hypothetical protein